MELSSQEGEIPIPINSSTYGLHHHHNHHQHHHHQPHHHHHMLPSTNGSSQTISTPPPPQTQTTPLDHHQPIDSPPQPPPPTQNNNVVVPYKNKMVRYKECLKNHAASMGGNATDGCGEFMPSGEEGTIEALTCSACNCHRNFHRKEIEGDHLNNNNFIRGINIPKVILGHPHKGLYPTRATPQQMVMFGDDHDEEMEDIRPHHPPMHFHPKKRHRTKFTQEQKDKMLNFAEKVGWKIQKQEESVVQQFCQEIGVKRRVLKVWMHNNKHNLAKKQLNINTTINPPPSTQPI